MSWRTRVHAESTSTSACCWSGSPTGAARQPLSSANLGARTEHQAGHPGPSLETASTHGRGHPIAAQCSARGRRIPPGVFHPACPVTHPSAGCTRVVPEAALATASHPIDRRPINPGDAQALKNTMSGGKESDLSVNAENPGSARQIPVSWSPLPSNRIRSTGSVGTARLRRSGYTHRVPATGRDQPAASRRQEYMHVRRRSMEHSRTCWRSRRCRCARLRKPFERSCSRWIRTHVKWFAWATAPLPTAWVQGG